MEYIYNNKAIKKAVKEIEFGDQREELVINRNGNSHTYQTQSNE